MNELIAFIKLATPVTVQRHSSKYSEIAKIAQKIDDFFHHASIPHSSILFIKEFRLLRFNSTNNVYKTQLLAIIRFEDLNLSVHSLIVQEYTLQTLKLFPTLNISDAIDRTLL